MKLYNIEIFTPEFGYRSSAQVDTIEHAFDYLDIEKAKVKVPGKITAQKGDWIHITKGTFAADGIISDTKEKSKYTEVEYKPFNRIFDVNIYTDMSGLADMTLENWLKALIDEMYVHNDDALQNIAGLETRVVSSHENAVLANYSTGINNLYDMIIDAFTAYGVLCMFSMDVQKKKLILEIGSIIEEPFFVEADLNNVLEKNIIIKEAAESTNKLIIYNEEDFTQKIVFYRDADDNITTEDSNRAAPVVCDTVTVKIGKDKTFEESAREKAENTLKASVYDNLIEITVPLDDELVRPTERVIGQQAVVMSGQMRYSTVLTAVEYDEDKITLIFGAIRLELTKQLKRRFRRWDLK